jgi:uncharacterized repeat protein (TIGR03803 family)
MQRNDSHLTLRRLCAVLFLTLLATSYKATAQNFKLLHSFDCTTGACEPYGGIVFDTSGNLYGTTPGGGDADAAIFKLTASGGRWTYTLLHTLTLGEGSAIAATLAVDQAGHLYGTSINGGTYDFGTVFELSPGKAAPGQRTITVAHSFDPFVGDGAGPWDKVILDEAGNLYGTTRDGGPEGAAGGVVFELTPDSHGDWTEGILYNFPANSDGCCSYSEVLFDKAGNLYGTGSGDGGPPCFCGVVFRLQPTSTGWKETVLHRFHGSNGEHPMGGLVLDAEGNLYGTTAEGGKNGSGTVFKLAPAASGPWKETILYDFPQFKNGGGPASTLIFDKGGNLYGTAVGGIGPCPSGCGVVFKLAPASNGKWQYSVLHRFTDATNDGAEVFSGVVFDKTGKHLYGTTAFGGTYNQGVVYEVTP